MLRLTTLVPGFRTMASTAKSTGSNRLAFEKSPYLLQHQNNPVDWYPWSSEAFEAARSKNLPIFLSVGYSTCHWCHVMERESFESEEIADILNANFVSIKVDREERPDVDKLYMSFIQALSGHGGWPMTVFLTPNLEPITGGTYFPPKDSMGRPGFASIIRMISKGWNSNQADMIEQGKNIIMALNESAATTSVDDLPPIDSAINHAYQYYDKRFDNVHGGFGGAPKFPKPVDLEYLLNYSQWEKDNPRSQNAVDMLRLTLDKIAQGGIHDHIGKGFHRYSVDGEWHVPHFEKMLYDQAQLLSVYSDYHLLTGRHQEVVRDIVDYMTTDLKHPEGGFYTAEDADSLPQRDSEEKREGAFCVWEHHDVVRALEDRFVGEVPLADIFCDYFDIRPEGNVPKEIDAHNELSNQNVLRVRHTVTDLAVRFGVEERLVKPAIEEAKKVLAGIRSNRPPPHLDSKMVASLQGLAISGLARASVSLKEPSYRLLAEEAAEFVRRYMIDDGDSLLRAVYRAEDGGITQGQQDIGAFSDDYAELIQGLLDLYQVNGDSSLLRWAYELQTDMNEKFWDSTNNAGYFIGEANGDVAVRMMEDQDGAEPCANSVAACNLVRFWALLGSEECRNKAMQIMTASALKLQKYPYIIPKTVLAYKQLADGFNKIVLVAHSLVHDENSTSNFKAQILGHYRCNLHLLELDPTADNAWLLSMCPEYGDMLSAPVPSVFICRGTQCSLPIRDADKLAEALKEL